MSPPTLGQKLREAREARGLTLEDAGRATKIRAIRLAEIEHNVYSNCPSLAYARGFAVIYGSYLGVDAAPHLEEFEVSSTVGLDDYQYLSHKPVVSVQKDARRIEQRNGARHSGARRSVATLSAALVALFVTIFTYVVYVNFQRLGDLDRLAAKQNGQLPPEAQTADAKHPPTALAAAQPMDSSPLPSKPEPIIEQPIPAAMATPVPVRFYQRGTAQGLRNQVIHSPNQPRPDLMQP